MNKTKEPVPLLAVRSNVGLADIPLYVWVVTRKRTRSGKPPLKIAPHRIDACMDAKIFYCAGDQRGRDKEVRYLIEECFDNQSAAAEKVRMIVAQELHNEEVRLKKLRAKLKTAMKVANVQGQGRCAALSRSVPCTAGLGIWLPKVRMVATRVWLPVEVQPASKITLHLGGQVLRKIKIHGPEELRIGLVYLGGEYLKHISARQKLERGAVARRHEVVIKNHALLSDKQTAATTEFLFAVHPDVERLRRFSTS
jgi:hypothetical protein